MLKAGVSLIDISPEKGVQMAGYPHCPRPNTGVHDPLYAACMYLECGKSRIALVTADILYLGKLICAEVQAKFDFKIIFTSSHTHSGPWSSTPLASELAEGLHNDETYIPTLIEKLEKVVREAFENTFDACLGTNIGHCGAEQGVGGNRRDKNGVQDPTVNVIAVKDKSDRVRGILLNYALHPTYLHAESTVVTADYPAYVRGYLKYAAPDAVFMFAQGTSGNQSSRYFRTGQNFEEAARVGTTLGVEIFHTLEKMEYFDDIDIEYKTRSLELPIREYPPLDEAKAEMEAMRKRFHEMDDSDYIRKRNAELDMFGSENIYSYSAMASKGDFHDNELPCEVIALKLGHDTVIATTQGEIFVEFGLAIKRASPFKKTFVFEVTNGSLPGYMYTPEAGAEGGYEVGTSVFTEKAGAVVQENLIEMINELA